MLEVGTLKSLCRERGDDKYPVYSKLTSRFQNTQVRITFSEFIRFRIERSLFSIGGGAKHETYNVCFENHLSVNTVLFSSSNDRNFICPDKSYGKKQVVRISFYNKMCSRCH